MGPRHVAAVTVLLLTGSLLVTAPVQAQRPDREDRAARQGPSHFPASIETSVPPGHNSSLTSPTIPKKAKRFQVTIEVDEDGSTTSFEELQHYFAQPMTKSAKLLTCIGLQIRMNFEWDQDALEFESGNLPLSIIFLAACMQAAGLINAGAPVARSAAAPAKACSKAYGALPARLKKSKSGPRLVVDGKPRPVRKPKVKVRCKARDGKVVYTFRAKKKGVPVRKVVGKRPAFGILNPPDAKGTAIVDVTFNAK